ncbi:MAG: SMC-Scp complex subunit ScpB [Alphaproteobacteria bacterium]|nr:SMC-Scp complex subunit ScpB [Alphaproteobacteria bacterium]
MTLERFQLLRILEAMLFASHAPLSEKDLAVRLPKGANIVGMLDELKAQFANRGVHLTPVGTGWAFRTAPDLAAYMEIEKSVVRRLSRAAVETLAIVAYHQPVTRAEIEEIRGVSLSRGTLDILLEAGWIRPRGRRQVPGKPITWGTSDAFLDHFGLESLSALPGVEELKAAGLLDKRQSWSPIMEIEAGDVDADEIGDDEVYEAVETDDAIAMDK